MNAKVEILNDTTNRWVPDTSQCQNWLDIALQTINFNSDCEVSFRFVDETESAVLNHGYRGKDSPTNVLSFPAELPEEVEELLQHKPLGDIVLCPLVIENEAEEQGKTLQAHWAHLTVHGVLHLMSFDHDTDERAAIMEKLEIMTLEKLGIQNPYLIG